MHLISFSNQVPDFSLSQVECWEIFQKSGAYDRVNDSSRDLLKRVLLGENGIEQRHFANNDFTTLFDQDAETLNRIFENEGPKLGASALQSALQQAKLLPKDIDCLLVCTCTGYLCPGLSSFISEIVGIRSDAHLQDIVGLGCGALIPTLRSANHFLKANPDSTVAVIALEICSAAFYIDDDPGVLISLCLFGDGCSASIWRAEETGSIGKLDQFDTLHWPNKRELLRFENKDGKLRNRLHLTVPAISSKAVEELIHRNGPEQFSHLISHGGGRDVLLSIERKLPSFQLSHSRETLAAYGNMSSPSVFFALENHLNRTNSNSNLAWLTSFGAGFSCHGCRFERLV